MPQERTLADEVNAIRDELLRNAVIPFNSRHLAHLRSEGAGSVALLVPLDDSQQTRDTVIRERQAAVKDGYGTLVLTGLENPIDFLATRFHEDQLVGRVVLAGSSQNALGLILGLLRRGVAADFVAPRPVDPNALPPRFLAPALATLAAAQTLVGEEFREQLQLPEGAAAKFLNHDGANAIWYDRQRSGAKRVAIAISAQHDPDGGHRANEEYLSRIAEAVELAESLPAGTPVTFLVMGAIHQGYTKSLAELGADELKNRFGRIDDVVRLENVDGKRVGNAELEVRAVSRWVQDNPDVVSLWTVSGPEQGMRKALMHELATGVSSHFVYPSPFGKYPQPVPTKRFHNPVWEGLMGIHSALSMALDPSKISARDAHGQGRTSEALARVTGR